MRIKYDTEADALDIQILEHAVVSRTEQLDSGTLVDLDKQGSVVAIEVMHPARDWPLHEVMGRFEIDEDTAAVLQSLWEQPEQPYPFVEPIASEAMMAAA